MEDKIRKAWNEAYNPLVADISDALTLEEICCMFFELGWKAALERNVSLQWQTGEPKEGGYYLITTDSGRITTDLWRIFPNRRNWEYRNKFDVVAWCKLSDIEPYKE